MTDEEALDAQVARLERRLPPAAARTLRWLRQPSARWVRWPAALLLVAGGLVGFLPVLGFWMVPLGLVLLAQDVAPLRRPLRRGIVWGERRWAALRRRWQAGG